MPTIRLIPSTYFISNTTYGSVTNAGNMYTDVDSTTYGYFTHGQASASRTISCKVNGFNFEDLPEGIEYEDNLSLKVRLKARAQGLEERYAGLSNQSGASIITGTESNVPLTNEVQTVECIPNQTLAQILNLADTSWFGITFVMKRAEQYTTGYYYVYGVEFDITYGDQDDDKLYVKENGAYKEVSKAYKKVNGVYVEQTDVTSVFVSGTNYKRGNS